MSGRRRSSRTRSGSAGGERLGAGRRALDLEALAAQTLGERLGDRVLVLDDQDAHALILTHAGGRCGIRTLPNLCHSLAEALPRARPRLATARLPSKAIDPRRYPMKKIHVLAVAALLGVAAVLGVVAATRTTALGAAAQAKASKPPRTTSGAQRSSASWSGHSPSARQSRPPALPAYLRSATGGTACGPGRSGRRTAGAGAAGHGSAAAPRVVYHRPRADRDRHAHPPRRRRPRRRRPRGRRRRR